MTELPTPSFRLPSDLDTSSGIFELAPVSLWLDDYSGVKAVLYGWRAAGVTALR